MGYQENFPAGEEGRAFPGRKPEYTGSLMSREVDKETGEVQTKEEAERRKEEKKDETLH
ncbi:MAG: hypothetical protein WC835_03490 [Candidatus Paceibacterota bacterium]|jgi:hypothetical protein